MLIHIDFSNHIIGLHFDLLWHAFAQVLILHAEPQQSFKGVADDTKEASQVLATWAVCNYVSASVFWVCSRYEKSLNWPTSVNPMTGSAYEN